MAAIKAEMVLYAELQDMPASKTRDSNKLVLVATYTPRRYDSTYGRWANIPGAKTIRILITMSGRHAQVTRDMYNMGVLQKGTPIIAIGQANDLPELREYHGQPVQTIIFHAQTITRDLVKEELLRQSAEQNGGVA